MYRCESLLEDKEKVSAKAAQLRARLSTQTQRANKAERALTNMNPEFQRLRGMKKHLSSELQMFVGCHTANRQCIRHAPCMHTHHAHTHRAHAHACTHHTLTHNHDYAHIMHTHTMHTLHTHTMHTHTCMYTPAMCSHITLSMRIHHAHTPCMHTQHAHTHMHVHTMRAHITMVMQTSCTMHNVPRVLKTKQELKQVRDQSHAR